MEKISIFDTGFKLKYLFILLTGWHYLKRGVTFECILYGMNVM